MGTALLIVIYMNTRTTLTLLEQKNEGCDINKSKLITLTTKLQVNRNGRLHTVIRSRSVPTRLEHTDGILSYAQAF